MIFVEILSYPLEFLSFSEFIIFFISFAEV